MLQLNNARRWRIGLGIVLSALDFVVSFLLILGGANLAVRSPAAGIGFAASGFALLYFAVGLWGEKTWKMKVRALTYWCASAIVVFVGYQAYRYHANVSRNVGIAIAAILIGTALSQLHLRLRKQEDPHNQ
jgi:hypothetical protein